MSSSPEQHQIEREAVALGHRLPAHWERLSTGSFADSFQWQGWTIHCCSCGLAAQVTLDVNEGTISTIGRVQNAPCRQSQPQPNPDKETMR